MSKILIKLMGLKCWKCHVPMGALCIPDDVNETPESIAKFLLGKEILPICEKCVIENPNFVPASN